ncbi:MAG: Cys-Gln thioester bond-forming surface protein [Clostridia bacterium]|nr:Cys-Gln thioester bond-forming surface protein [Clostridia bacterium]
MLFFLISTQPTLADQKSKPLAGKTLSIMGDSISTYTGWSDAYPITDPSCTNRYGEAYYGPAGGDFHNTDLLVTDTWWHQAATELGMEILMSNAGNSTGVFHAEYPYNADWDLYLKEMLAWKSRPYYLGKDGKSPDLIALYIGSNEAGRCAVGEMGSIDEVDLDALIQKNPDGSFTYKTPANVAEAYSILLHKVKTAYPNAEIYCFAVVPNAGGNVNAVNGRMERAIAFNNMVKGVAKHFGANIVDLFSAFDLSSSLSQSEFERFASYYNNDPHPNAAGFDVITEAFVSAILENTRYIVSVETSGGRFENVGVEATPHTGGDTGFDLSAENYITEKGYLVNYGGASIQRAGVEMAFSEEYTSDRGSYHAAGGRGRETELIAPKLQLEVPLVIPTGGENPHVFINSTATEEPVYSGDVRDPHNPYDGIYDYSVVYRKPTGRMEITTQALEVKEVLGKEHVKEMSFVASDTLPNDTNQLITKNVTLLQRPLLKEDVPSIAPGYQFVLVGSDQFSYFWSAHAHESPMDSFPDETPTYTEEDFSLYVGAAHSVFKSRNLVVPRMYFANKTVELEDPLPARYDSVQQFTLSNSEGSLVTTYCADKNTSAEDGYSYNIKNLEDAHYYTEHDAQKIRAIAKKAYWGPSSGYGSLTSFKENLEKEGVLTPAELALVTDGIALTATQYAIWTFSNSMDGIRFLNAYYTTNVKSVGKAAAKEYTDVLFKIYRYLISVEPEPVTVSDPTTENTIINEKNFLKGLSLTLQERTDAPENSDDDPENDVYRADLSFRLAVKPEAGNDDNLVMHITDGSGATIAKIRIAGAVHPGEIEIIPDEDGTYTLSDVILSEGLEQVSFLLSGSQQLEKDVHLFVSEDRAGETSQTMVGIAEGKRGVYVGLRLEFSLSVTDDQRIYENHWRTEENDPPQVPPTGEGAGPLFWLSLMGISLWILVLTRKKYKGEVSESSL